MGSTASCKKCESAATGSIINMSDALMLRIAEGIEQPKLKEEFVSMDDGDWFEKLKCLDDQHSSAYGLTIKDLDGYIRRLERFLKDLSRPEYCMSNLIMRCYKLNSNCSLKCAKEMDEFMDCLDTKRLEKLKAIHDKETAKRKEAEMKAEAKRKYSQQ